MDSNRKTAYLTLLSIEKNDAFSNLELNQQIRESHPDSPAFVRELVYGVLRNKLYLDHLLLQLIPRGLKGQRRRTMTLLRMGLYQIIFMESVPDYAAVSETVKLARRYLTGRDGFINGVLRGYLRKQDQLQLPDRKKELVRFLSVRYSYDEWIVRLWLDQYGEEKAEELLAAGNETPPLSIRVNRLKTDTESLQASLTKKGYQVFPGSLSERALFVKGSNLLDTPEYHQGLFSIQDESSILAADSLGAEKGETIFDICAAPGGKTLALAEMMGDQGTIRAFDLYEHKLALLEEEAKRLGITIVQIRVNDGTKQIEELREKADRVMVDAPCSGLGVVRRKPEIKYRVQEDGGRELAALQLKLLQTSSGYVRKGGILQYSTCTINQRENAGVVTGFLKRNQDFELISSRQLLTGKDETDGFFICKMRRREGWKGGREI